MMLGNADTPASQSIDDMWLKTTHFWINTYRVAARRADAQIASLSSPSRDDHPYKAERNKIHTHFRQALKNEEVVYRTLIVDLVKRWQLESLVQKHLRTIGIKIKPFDIGAGQTGSIGLMEKKEKLRLVSYALCSLGDMQRYRTQLKVQMDQASGKTTSVSADSSEHAKAREYYDCARYIDFENGELPISARTPLVESLLTDCRLRVSSTRCTLQLVERRLWYDLLPHSRRRLQTAVGQDR